MRERDGVIAVVLAVIWVLRVVVIIQPRPSLSTSRSSFLDSKHFISISFILCYQKVWNIFGMLPLNLIQQTVSWPPHLNLFFAPFNVASPHTAPAIWSFKVASKRYRLRSTKWNINCEVGQAGATHVTAIAKVGSIGEQAGGDVTASHTQNFFNLPPEIAARFLSYSLHNSHQQCKTFSRSLVVFVRHSFIIIILLLFLFHLRLVNIWMEILLRFLPSCALQALPRSKFDDDESYIAKRRRTKNKVFFVWSSKIPIARSPREPRRVSRIRAASLCAYAAPHIMQTTMFRRNLNLMTPTLINDEVWA